MRNEPQEPTCEPLHLLLVRAVVSTGTLLILLAPMTTTPVVCASIVAALIGLVLGRLPAASKARLPVVLVGAALVALSGFGISSLLGRSSSLAGSLGVPGVLDLTEGIRFSLATLAVVTVFRVLSLRRPMLALIEVAACAGAVILLFASHRDGQLSQPRFLADWAFSHGLGPDDVLVKIGLVTLLALVLLLLPRQRWTRTVTVIVVLPLLWLGLGLLLPLLAAGPDNSDAATMQTDPPNYDDRPPNLHSAGVVQLMFHTDYQPIDGCLHLRDLIYTDVVNNRLVPAQTLEELRDVPQSFSNAPVAVSSPELPADMRLEVRTTVAFLIPHSRPSMLISPVRLLPEVNPDRKRYTKVFGAVSTCLAWPTKGAQGNGRFAALRKLPAGDPSWSAEERAHYLGVPNDPRYAELAKEVLAKAGKAGELSETASPLEKALAFEAWLNIHTIYTLRPGIGTAADPVAEFLFRTRRGYCLYTASAMTYLLRTEGIPARVAVGYCAAARRLRGSGLVITDKERHAWCEIYLHGIGWLPLEVHQLRSEDPPAPDPDPEWEMYLLNKFSYDNKAYQERKKRFENGDLSALDDEEGSFAWLWKYLPPHFEVGLAGFPVVVVLFLYLVKGWRRLAPHLGRAPGMYRLAYRATLDRLAEVGVVRRFGESREEFAARLKEQVPEMEDLTLGHLRRALGGIDPLDRAGWLRLSKQVRQRLRGLFSRTRRFLGLINPMSWLWVH